jgi:uncharacterized membrane protein
MEAVILSSCILMRRNRMMRRGELRGHLNRQIDLLAEKEITKLLQMVRAISEHMRLQEMMLVDRSHRYHLTSRSDGMYGSEQSAGPASGAPYPERTV